MTLLPDTASFHEKVQACFVTFRRRGVALSSSDVELLEEWASHRVPFEVIARGIRKAAEAHLYDAVDSASGPESLKSCRREVETEIKRYLRESAGRGQLAASDDFLVKRHKKLKGDLKKMVRPDGPRWLGRLKVPATFAEAERQEAVVVFLLLRTLPFTQRTSLLREARRLVEKGAVLSAAAARESLRFHRLALTRQALSMPSQW